MHPPDPFANRYNDLRLVGRGGFGEVYRAWDTDLDREVALKLLNSELATDPDWRKRFRLEATAASKLNHPNITIVHDRGEYQGQPFIVMEFVQGEPLSKIIEHRTPLTDPERLFLIEQLCDGLHYAHQRNIVHRDVKPVNLVVREEHDGTHIVRTLKILDFGIAKIVNAGQTATGGQLMFTPSYVSPEQIRGLEVDRRSDMFAVGAVAYQLLVGTKAFVIRTTNPFSFLEEVKQRIVELPHRPMTDFRPDLDPELSDIVNRALEKVPDNRYRDLAEMRRRLRSVRERMEEALGEDESQTTIVLPPVLQAEVRAARDLLEADDPSGAVERLDRALALAPNQFVRRFIEQSLEEARERQSARRAERKGRDEQAAREAIAAATELFEQGEGQRALQALEQFTPRPLVAEQLALFTRALSLLQAAKHAVEEGARAEREAALLELNEFPAQDLVAAAATRLRDRAAERLAQEEAERIEKDRIRERDEIERAKQAIDAARHLFQEGKGTAALQTLDEFNPRSRVAEEIALLASAARLVDATERAVTEGTRAEREAALAELSRFSPDDLVRESVARLRDRAAERLADEERIRELQSSERAREAVAASRELFSAGQRDAAIHALEAADAPERVAAALKQLRDAGALIDHATSIIESGAADDRARTLEELETFADASLLKTALESLRAIDRTRRVKEADAAADAAVDAAVEDFEAGDRQAALEALEGLQSAHPRVVEALGQLRQRDAELAAEERLRAAAEALKARVRREFIEGNRADAIGALEAFERADLVEVALGELRHAGAVIDTATNAVRNGGRAERERALTALTTFTPADLVSPAVRELQSVALTRDADEDREAEQAAGALAQSAIGAARNKFQRGARSEAVAMLEQFGDRPRVATALDRLRKAKEVIDVVAAAVASGNHVDRAEALERLTQFGDGNLVASALVELRAIDEQRRAAEQHDQAAAAIIESANEQFDRGDRSGALASLQQFRPPHPSVTTALGELRRIAVRRDRDDQENREARSLIAAARAAFMKGERASAIAQLEQKRALALVANALAEFQRASEAITLAEQAIEQGEEKDRSAVLTNLARFQPAQLVEAALQRLGERARQRISEEEALRVEAAAAATHARERFIAGDVPQALEILRTFRTPALVAGLLRTLQDAAQETQNAFRIIETGSSSERHAALETLARLDPRDLFAPALAELRQKDQQRALDEARREAERQAEEAKRTSARAMEQFAGGNYETAIRALEAFQPARLVEGTLTDLREALQAIVEARRAVANGDDESRPEAIGALRAFRIPGLVDSAATQLHEEHLARRAAAQRKHEQYEREVQAARDAIALALSRRSVRAADRALREAEGAFPNESHWASLRAQLQDLRNVLAAEPSRIGRAMERIRETPLAGRAAAALLALILVFGTAWAVWLRPGPADHTPGPTKDYAVEFADAERAYDQGLVKDAIGRALSVTSGAPEPIKEQAVGLLQRIREAAATDTTAARAKAESAQSTAEPDFLGAVAKQSEAHALSDLSSTERAVALYGDAAQLFRSAAAKAFQPDEAVREAELEFRAGRIPRALQYLQRPLQSETPYQPAVALLNRIRQQVRARAADAKAALKGTAATTTKFKTAEGKMQTADKLTGFQDAARQLESYNEAEALYKGAAVEEMDSLLADAQVKYDAGRVFEAIDGLQRALQRVPNHEPALKLLGRIRSAAQGRASAAKATLKAAASGTQQFKNAEAKMQAAEQLTAIDSARRQVQTYNEAEALYKEAGEALGIAGRRHDDAVAHLRKAQEFLDSRKFSEADSEVDEALKLEKSDEANALRRKIEDSRRLAIVEAIKAKVDDLLERSKKATDAEAVALLGQALDLDPARDDIRRERDRRAALVPSPPRVLVPSPPPVDVAASVRTTIADFVAAYSSGDLARAKQLKPSFRGYGPDVKSSSVTASNVDVQLSSDQQTATVTLTIQYRYVFRKFMPEGAVNPKATRVTWRLTRTGSGWIILE